MRRNKRRRKEEAGLEAAFKRPLVKTMSPSTEVMEIQSIRRSTKKKKRGKWNRVVEKAANLVLRNRLKRQGFGGQRPPTNLTHRAVAQMIWV